MAMFNTILAIRTSSAANRLIYYAQKLPWIGKRISPTVYASLRVKKTISIIAFMLSVVWGIVSKLLYLGLLVYLPVAVLGAEKPEEEQWQLFLHSYLLISCIVAGVSSAMVLEPKRDKYIGVKLMRIPPDRYMRVMLSYRYITYFLYSIPALIVCIVPLGVSAGHAVTLSAAVTLWRVFCEWLHLVLFDKTGFVVIRSNAIVSLTIVLGYAAAYLPLLTEKIPPIGGQLPIVPAAIVALAAGCCGAWQLARYRGYREAVDAASRRDDPLLNIGQLMTDSKKAQVRLKDSDISRANLSRGIATADGQGAAPGNKQGYAYLNDLFFTRHRSLIQQPVRKRLAIIGTTAVAVVALMLAGLMPQAVIQSDWRPFLPCLAFIMYFLSVGEKKCRAMFYNCDLSLMRYGFYRKSASRHFRIRFVRMTGLNLTIAIVLGFAIMLMALAGGKEAFGAELLLMRLSVLGLSVFFSVHHLFMYYFFQPYSTELNVKNPLFAVVNMLVSATCGIGIWVRIPGPAFTIGVCVLTIAYTIVALTLISRFGSRTFRVK